MSEPEKSFESWAIVELFGHQVVAGRVSERIIAGAGFLQVDAPEEDGGFVTRLVSPKAVYGIRPCTEDVARAQAKRLGSQRPVMPTDWSAIGQLTSGERDGDDGYDREPEE